MKKVELLEKQLNYVKNHIPYYMNQDQLKTIDNFPIISKSVIKNNYNLFISDRYSDIKNELVDRMSSKIKFDKYIIEKQFTKDIIIEKTSGSSGVPFYCAKTIKERTLMGYRMWERRHQIDPEVNQENFMTVNHQGLRQPEYNYRDTSLDNVKKLYKYLDENQIRWLHIQPRILINHMKILNEASININLKSLKFCEVNGEYLSDYDKLELERFFNVKVINHYGLIETWAIALSCIHGDLHIIDKNAFIEILDDENNAISKANVPGKVVVTSFHQKLLPFIRYDTGDYGYYIDKKCDCCPEGKAIKLLKGREINIIRGIDRIIYGNIFFQNVLKQISYKLNCNDLLNIRIIQTEINKFLIYVNEFQNVHEFFQMLQNSIEELMGFKIIVEYYFEPNKVFQDNIEKHQIFISQVNPYE